MTMYIYESKLKSSKNFSSWVGDLPLLENLNPRGLIFTFNISIIHKRIKKEGRFFLPSPCLSLAIYLFVARLHVLEITQVTMYLPQRCHLSLLGDFAIGHSKADNLHGVDPVCLSVLAPCVCNTASPERRGTSEIIERLACLETY